MKFIVPQYVKKGYRPYQLGWLSLAKNERRDSLRLIELKCLQWGRLISSCYVSLISWFGDEINDFVIESTDCIITYQIAADKLLNDNDEIPFPNQTWARHVTKWGVKRLPYIPYSPNYLEYHSQLTRAGIFLAYYGLRTHRIFRASSIWEDFLYVTKWHKLRS